MTSFSTYATSHIQFVDGGLSTDEEKASEQLSAIIQTVAAGAARTLLDLSPDLSGDNRPVYAEQWHTPAEGWEIEAISDHDQLDFLDVVQQFVTADLDDILCLVERIA